ncbi:MAG: RnfABCDGE type electron transport complex subunit D [Oscillospiraceae bacterium]|jgi:electron transport complex protein RnfD|nr:RnfABCDGE type electron transport complex subunit D [Oscillospiraceae bacterium]
MSTNPDFIDTEPRHTSFFKRKPRHIYGDQLLFLLVLLGMAVLQSGTRSFGLAFVAVLTSVAVDILCCYFTRKIYNPRDLSTFTSGLCLALMSPATLPFSLLVFGSALAIGVKHIFGGKDNYIFNPTAVAFAFLIICYPANMLLFPAVGENLPLLGDVPVPTSVGIENFLLRRGAFPAIAPLDILLGNFPGPIGTTHVLIIIISAVCLLLRRSVSFVVTVSFLSVITISRLLFPLYDDVIGALVRELVGGYLLFALLFLANDPQTIPKTVFGRLYYGVLLGVLTIVFRGGDDGIFKSRVEGWFIFALLIANSLSCRMDIAAARVSAGAARLADSLKEKLSAYERFSEDAKSGKIYDGDLTATMEIDLDLSNYHMPAIDNKVIKINRKKRNLLTYVIELAGSLREKTRNNAALPIPYSDADERKTPFVVTSFKTLFESIKSTFAKKSPETVETAPLINISDVLTDVEPEPEPEKETEIDITDFEEIAKDIIKIENKPEFTENIENSENSEDML